MNDIDIKNKDIAIFAETNYRSQRKRFGIKEEDRNRHMYIIGKTGTGKSTLIENLISHDVQAGNGVALIDPHGDLVERVLSLIPKSRINDVIYFNPADVSFPIGFNVMEVSDDSEKHLVASGLISVFKKLWADSWGPRLEYVLRNCILALLDTPGTTLLGIMKMLVDSQYRARIVQKVSDPIVRGFWEEEFAKYPERFQAQAISPIQNKVGQFLSTSIIRNILGQVKSSFDIRDVMDNNKIFLMNLSKGRIGEDASALLGAMMITKLQLSAMSRIDIPESRRKNFFLYVDEFQNFATESFADILSEARKYGMGLILAHQYLAQLNDQLRAAIFGNVGTIISFRLGSLDARIMAMEFSPTFSADDIMALEKYQIYLKLSIDGTMSEPFSALTLPPKYIGGNEEIITRISRERYSAKKEIIEDKIERWAQNNTSIYSATTKKPVIKPLQRNIKGKSEAYKKNNGSRQGTPNVEKSDRPIPIIEEDTKQSHAITAGHQRSVKPIEHEIIISKKPLETEKFYKDEETIKQPLKKVQPKSLEPDQTVVI